MLACPHCSEKTLSRLRVMSMPARLRCPKCAGISRTGLGPSSFLGQALYLIIAMTVGLAIAWFGSSAPVLVWPSIVLSVVALVCYWSVIVPTLKPTPVHAESLTLAKAVSALRSGAFLRPLAWLLGLAGVAALYLLAVKALVVVALSY